MNGEEGGHIHIKNEEMNTLFHIAFSAAEAPDSFTASSVNNGLHPELPERKPLHHDCTVCR